jgi:hypothetical protein
MKQSWWVFTWAMSTLGNITSWDNVMIKFPVRWIKMSKSWSTVTLSITEELEKSGYQYCAFQNTWDIESNTESTATKPMYLWAYMNYKNSNVLKSWSGKTPQWNNTISNELAYSSANGTWYTIMWWYQRCLISAYYMMKYGNPNSQSVIWNWYVSWSSQQVTGATNSITNATGATDISSTWRIKLFWLEDFWGNQLQRLWWIFTDSSKNMYVALHDFTATISISQGQYKKAGSISSWTGRYNCMSSILGTNKWMFWPTSTVSNSQYNTYYCNEAYINGSCFALVGGSFWDDTTAGISSIRVSYGTSNRSVTVGSRLMYL